MIREFIIYQAFWAIIKINTVDFKFCETFCKGC